MSVETDGTGSTGEPIWARPYRPAWMRLFNATGRVLERLGVGGSPMDPAELMSAAERRTGLSDWGDGRFREGLTILVESFNAGSSTPFGRLFFRTFCVNLLVSRLRIQDDLKRHPEILDVPIRRPLFIVGLPRSGTTLLHRLMAQDPRARTLRTWETMEPSPPPRTETYETDPRIGRARRSIKGLYALAPQIRAAHNFEADQPEECNQLFANMFAAAILGYMFDVPEYVEWLGQTGHVENYAEFRRQLQLLSWRCPGDHWLLKAPAHLFSLDAVLANFPDASLVVTHRDPLKAVPSACSLAAALRGITTDLVDLRRLGADITEVLAVGVERALSLRETTDPARFFDVPYAALTADPIEVIQGVYRHFDYPFTPGFADRMKHWLAENPQHKHGVHRYSPEQFGLNPAAIHERFAGYRAWMTDHLPA